MHITIKTLVLCLSIFLIPSIVFSQESQTNEEDTSAITILTSDHEALIDSLEQEIIRLKKDKNDKKNQLADQRLDQLSLIAVLTLVSLFMLLLLYFFLSCRYKKKRAL